MMNILDAMIAFNVAARMNDSNRMIELYSQQFYLSNWEEHCEGITLSEFDEMYESRAISICDDEYAMNCILEII